MSTRWEGEAGPSKVLSREECEALFKRCVALASGGGEVHVTIDSIATGGLQWARNRPFVSRDLLQTTLRLARRRRGAGGIVSTTQLDDAGLKAAMRDAEFALDADVSRVGFDTRTHQKPAESELLQPKLWSTATLGFDGEHRSAAMRQMVAPVEAAGLLSAGELQIRSRSQSVFSTEAISKYAQTTRVVCSTTVRDAKGTGSGWAGVDDFDISRVDLAALGQRAFEKGRQAVNPVALEPGHYTTVLEPQAVADLWGQFVLFEIPLDRPKAEEFDVTVPFAKGNQSSRINDRVLDTRLSMSSDPMDPQGGFLPFRMEDGVPHRPIRWIDQGVLRELRYEQYYALLKLGRDQALLSPGSWRLSGGSSSVEEMIATTERGVLVTRFDHVTLEDMPSWTCSGYTRDGVWLIENGKVTKPVKNFGFTESPIFIFNRIDQIGAPQRVFSEAADGVGRDLAWIAPPLKVRDFNFSKLSDAV